jgi:predicted metal-dependent enzyme (double-stranded beta helix superfamily)
MTSFYTAISLWSFVFHRRQVRMMSHRMWAVIGIYTGREDNIYWRRLPPDADREIEAAGARSLCRGDCTPMGPDIIHSVTNPIGRLTGAIHVYGGDFLKQERSEWDPDTLHERPYDVAKARQLFEDSNSKRHQ